LRKDLAAKKSGSEKEEQMYHALTGQHRKKIDITARVVLEYRFKWGSYKTRGWKAENVYH